MVGALFAFGMKVNVHQNVDLVSSNQMYNEVTREYVQKRGDTFI